MRRKKKPAFKKYGNNLSRQFEDLLDAEYQSEESYILNPDSLYYYYGKNIFKLAGKFVLHLDHRFTNIPTEAEVHRPTIKFYKAAARQKARRKKT